MKKFYRSSMNEVQRQTGLKGWFAIGYITYGTKRRTHVLANVSGKYSVLIIVSLNRRNVKSVFKVSIKTVNTMAMSNSGKVACCNSRIGHTRIAEPTA